MLPGSASAPAGRPTIPFEQSLHDILEYWREEMKKQRSAEDTLG